MRYKLKSGQINYESTENRGAFQCIVIRDGVIYNMTEEARLDLIKTLQSYAPKASSNKETVDLEDMF
jgi:hypothetical protein